jgi:hypothetical protein
MSVPGIELADVWNQFMERRVVMGLLLNLVGGFHQSSHRELGLVQDEQL